MYLAACQSCTQGSSMAQLGRGDICRLRAAARSVACGSRNLIFVYVCNVSDASRSDGWRNGLGLGVGYSCKEAGGIAQSSQYGVQLYALLDSAQIYWEINGLLQP